MVDLSVAENHVKGMEQVELRCRRLDRVVVDLAVVKPHVNRTTSWIVQVNFHHAPSAPNRMHNLRVDFVCTRSVGTQTGP